MRILKKTLPSYKPDLPAFVSNPGMPSASGDQLSGKELASDPRVQELLNALNEGILELKIVKSKLEKIARRRVEIYRYRNGEYFLEG